MINICKSYRNFKEMGGVTMQHMRCYVILKLDSQRKKGEGGGGTKWM